MQCTVKFIAEKLWTYFFGQLVNFSGVILNSIYFLSTKTKETSLVKL